MKAAINLLILFFVMCPFLSAQEQGLVKLNIILNPVLNLTVHPQQTSTTLAYNTLEDYQNGVEVLNKEHITVSSTGPYEVNVRLVEGEFLQMGGPEEKKLQHPQIKITAIPVAPDASVQLQTATITTENQNIISGKNSVLNKVFDVSYQGPGEEYFLEYISSSSPVQFSNTLLYSIETR